MRNRFAEFESLPCYPTCENTRPPQLHHRPPSVLHFVQPTCKRQFERTQQVSGFSLYLGRTHPALWLFSLSSVYLLNRNHPPPAICSLSGPPRCRSILRVPHTPRCPIPRRAMAHQYHHPTPSPTPLLPPRSRFTTSIRTCFDVTTCSDCLI